MGQPIRSLAAKLGWKVGQCRIEAGMGLLPIQGGRDDLFPGLRHGCASDRTGGRGSPARLSGGIGSRMVVAERARRRRQLLEVSYSGCAKTETRWAEPRMSVEPARPEDGSWLPASTPCWPRSASPHDPVALSNSSAPK